MARCWPDSVVDFERRRGDRSGNHGDGGRAGYRPVLLEKSLSIGLLENAADLGKRLSELTAELMVAAMPRIEAAGPGPRDERLSRLGVRERPMRVATPACFVKTISLSIGASPP